MSVLSTGSGRGHRFRRGPALLGSVALAVAMLALALVSGIAQAAPQNATIDFEGLGEGSTHGSIAVAGKSVVVSSATFGGNPDGSSRAMIFDATCQPGGTAADCTGGDTDLLSPGQGNILIRSVDNDGTDPNDGGGFLVFDFSAFGTVTVNSLVALDTEEDGDQIFLFGAGGLADPLPSVNIPSIADGAQQTVGVNTGGVTIMAVRLESSGAVDDISFTYDGPPPPPPPPPPGDPEIRVIKQVDNTGGGTLTPADFILHVQNETFAGSSNGVTRMLSAGAFEVTEDEHPDYTATFSGDCSGTAQDGHFYTCTVTNTYDPQPTPTPTVAGANIGIDNTRITASPTRPGEPVNFRIDVTLDVPDANLATVWVQFDPTELQFDKAPEGCALMAEDLIRCDFGNRNDDFSFVAEFTGLKVTESAETNAALGADFDADGTIDGEAGPAFADGVIIDVEGLQIPPLGDGSTGVTSAAAGGTDARSVAVLGALVAGLVLAWLGARAALDRREA